jgi:hypothetical protein
MRRAKSPTPATPAEAGEKKSSSSAALSPPEPDAKAPRIHAMYFFLEVTTQILFATLTWAALAYTGEIGKFSRSRVKTLAERSVGPVLISLWFFRVASIFFNSNISMQRFYTGCKAPNQHIYKVMGGSANGSIVLMDEEGINGAFNRAQRGLQNTVESGPLFLVCWLFVVFVFPWTASAIMIVYALARLSFAFGYTSTVSSRGAGLIISSLCNEAVVGIVLWLGARASYLEVKTLGLIQ